MDDSEVILDQLNRITLPSGISLEATIAHPSYDESTDMLTNRKLAICLHPWSWLGGRRDDPVLMELTEPLTSKGYHVLRYNSRGVGASTGRASFTGFSEVEDLEAVVRWTLDRVSDIRSLVILGYSHGSLIASMQPVLSQAFPLVKLSHILLSYPLGPRSWLTLFNSSSYSKALEALVQHPDSNVLIIFGDRDEFTSQSNYTTWVSGLKGNVKVVEVKDASHFWRGHSGHELGEIVSKWLYSLDNHVT